jgi:hypothetical protein
MDDPPEAQRPRQGAASDDPEPEEMAALRKVAADAVRDLSSAAEVPYDPARGRAADQSSPGDKRIVVTPSSRLETRQSSRTPPPAG